MSLRNNVAFYRWKNFRNRFSGSKDYFLKTNLQTLPLFIIIIVSIDYSILLHPFWSKFQAWLIPLSFGITCNTYDYILLLIFSDTFLNLIFEKRLMPRHHISFIVLTFILFQQLVRIWKKWMCFSWIIFEMFFVTLESLYHYSLCI